jgi:DNA-binding CsgD family transcriptional regulator
LRRQNRRVDARIQMKAALNAFDTMGAQGFAERARRELLATGETVRRRTADARDSLTPQEAQIARLAARGQSNSDIAAQLYLSHRTVEWHLHKVFAKLGIISRKGLGRPCRPLVPSSYRSDALRPPVWRKRLGPATQGGGRCRPRAQTTWPRG